MYFLKVASETRRTKLKIIEHQKIRMGCQSAVVSELLLTQMQKHVKVNI